MNDDSEIANLKHVSLRYGDTLSLKNLTLALPKGKMIGLIGPDGVGKSSLLSLLAGARKIQDGLVNVLHGDISNPKHRTKICNQIAYMPQGLGRNLYPTLTVEENLDFFGSLFGLSAKERSLRIAFLTRETGLWPFLTRPVGKLSGGMKQKLGLCCALIHDPKFLILDEPTTGVDPLSRHQFWTLIKNLRDSDNEISVIVATAYMEEAEKFDWLVAMDAGEILSTGTPADILERTSCVDLDHAYIQLLPESKRNLHPEITILPKTTYGVEAIAIQATALTKRFGNFTAVDNIDISVNQGEIFGFIGSNGCGKTTTMKMLTGLIAPSSGETRLFGIAFNANDMDSRRQVGYMSQSFSLYTELTVKQNLYLHAKIFHLSEDEIRSRIDALISRFGLEDALNRLPDKLPLGLRQRLSLAVALVHSPKLLILDEPTSGVDPIARDEFWKYMFDLAHKDNVTIFISTHFMNEAERCDRVALMHAGKILVTDTPQNIAAADVTKKLEGAFISYLQQKASADIQGASESFNSLHFSPSPDHLSRGERWKVKFLRLWTYSLRETLELKRDPFRAALSILGTALLLFIIGYGISLDVEDLTYAVLDLDQTGIGHAYALNLSGSRYFIEQAPLTSYADIDKRMQNGELSVAIEIPPGFGRDVERGAATAIGVWVDGAMPTRAETIKGYVLAMHQQWLNQRQNGKQAPIQIETRYRYNPDVKSLPAMVPAIIPMLLMMIPAMLTALSVVREKELGSITNLYVTPVTRTEFLLGKQLPYIVLAMFNFAVLTLLAVTIFDVPLRGSFLDLACASLIFVINSTAFGLLASTFTKSQIAAIFFTMVGTIIPCVQFAGLLNPVSSLSGLGALIGHLYPATYYLIISRGIYSKGLDLGMLTSPLWAMAASVPIIIFLSIMLLKKQEA